MSSNGLSELESAGTIMRPPSIDVLRAKARFGTPLQQEMDIEIG